MINGFVMFVPERNGVVLETTLLLHVTLLGKKYATENVIIFFRDLYDKSM